MTDNPELTPEAMLRREVSGLHVDEILALCYSFQQRRQRLRLYLDVLRTRGGQRAQFACCLICFDLARQGDEAMQREFAILAGGIREISYDTGFVDSLLGEDPYLTFIWELLDAQLDEMDTRYETEHTVQTTHPSDPEDLATLDLLSEEDFGDELDDFTLEVDEPMLRAAFDQAVDRFLGKVPQLPAYDPSCGFRLGHRGDTERVERFLLELDSLRGPVPPARAFRALALLFYGTHMRSKSLFGAVNKRKQTLLRAGLREFIENGEQVWRIVGVLDMHAEGAVWSKIAEILLDYNHWLARAQPGEADPEHYEGVERQVERDRRRGGRRRSGRKSADY